MVYQIKLHKGELWNPATTAEVKELRVLAGKAWVTVEGSPEDYIIGEGELLPPPRQGVLIESLTAELIMQSDFSK
jgi:hypothetical protein